MSMPALTELKARAEEVQREWHWLHATLNEVARIHEEHGAVSAFRLLHDQAMAVGQRRLELSMMIAAAENAPGRAPINSDGAVYSKN